ncbi:MAG: hypothetical protein A4E47_00593 [Methanosaeta sp. PtaU1.Bin028]|nr:MAG: hypothetical protein A4E47_00593 [Methanosaeta sp. PtaU1.Bin028]
MMSWAVRYPTRQPIKADGGARITLSIMNIFMIASRLAPIAIIIPISLVRRVMIIIMVLAMPKPAMMNIST